VQNPPPGGYPAIANASDPQADFELDIKRTYGGQRWKEGEIENGQEAVSSATMQVQLMISGTDPSSCGVSANAWEARMRACTRYYVGARYVTVLGVKARPQPDRGRAGLNRTLTYTLELLDNLWRLSDDDVRPTRFPIEMNAGDYPLGLLIRNEDGTYSTLGGVSNTPGTLTTQAAGRTFTYQTEVLSYDAANEF